MEVKSIFTPFYNCNVGKKEPRTENILRFFHSSIGKWYTGFLAANSP